MDDEHQGKFDHWWFAFKRVVVFVLGVAVIIDSLIEKNYPSVGKLIVGLLMVGVLPLDDLLRLARRDRKGP
jgi:hypothetical protein